MVGDHSDIRFAVNCHSNVGFLQADANGVRLVREAMEVERGTWNFHVAGNSLKFCRLVTDTYRTPCQYPPNLYDLDAPQPHRPMFSGDHLRVGAFGATRPLKNFMSAAGAAVEVAAQLHANLELWVSAGRAEGVPSVVSDAIDWAPDHWKAPIDDVHEMARVARYLFADPHAPEDGRLALERHNRDGLEVCKAFPAA